MAARETDPVIRRLTGVPETMLITLAARVLAPRDNPDLGFRDPNAEAIAMSFDFDPARFRADRKSMRGTILRALWFDQQIAAWLDRFPNSLCISFGSGLDIRRPRLHNAGRCRWVDVELPEIHALRRRVALQTSGGLELVSDATDLTTWMADLPDETGRPVIFFAEGVFMYLEPRKIIALLRALVSYAHDHDSRLCVVLDYVSPFAMRHSQSNPSVRQTGANFAWAMRSPGDLTREVPGLQFHEGIDLTRRVDRFAWLAGRLYTLLHHGASLCGAARYEAPIMSK
ncbi:class I SAM-dependent methyltransferase [Asaia krungthepensis]|uniref:O-Methyltransferase n=1 Tax=Asaia krungthepensis NRIC 0535 TaxID=1307925 RepID=A0ABQ0Q6X0_9PROT|nr:class I SAM-dependent methyltransferase [Asaia krungthepensis]GBQ94035.1 O-Methyltransferase [Asaia krungthepensis NRIC 0535]